MGTTRPGGGGTPEASSDAIVGEGKLWLWLTIVTDENNRNIDKKLVRETFIFIIVRNVLQEIIKTKVF